MKIPVHFCSGKNSTFVPSPTARPKSLAKRAKEFYRTKMRRFTFLVVLLAFIFSCGGHWYLLQGVAWANMIRSYSEMVPFHEAVRMTLSGQYPCSLCKAIAQKKNDQQQESLPLEKFPKKFTLSSACSPFALISSPITHVDFVSTAPTRTDAPPVPPPRFSLV